MDNKRAGGYISQLTFNNRKSIDIEKNDIVVFVGHNNAGKSQALKDIYSLSGNKVPSVVVSDIKITKYKEPISYFLDSISSCNDQGNYKIYNVLGFNYTIYYNADSSFLTTPLFDSYRNLFIANLDTATRLTICNPPDNIMRDTPKSHPIHYAAFDRKHRKWLSDNFKKAFGIELIPNIQYGSKIPLSMGESVSLSGMFEDEQTRQEAYADILSKYKQVQNQDKKFYWNSFIFNA